jgi:hypothetical protein
LNLQQVLSQERIPSSPRSSRQRYHRVPEWYPPGQECYQWVRRCQLEVSAWESESASEK